MELNQFKISELIARANERGRLSDNESLLPENICESDLIKLSDHSKVICQACNLEQEKRLTPDWKEKVITYGVSSTWAFWETIRHVGCEEQLVKLEMDKLRKVISELAQPFVKETDNNHKLIGNTFGSYQCSKENETAVRLLQAWDFDKNDFGFLLTGPAGVGKSHLAKALFFSGLEKIVNSKAEEYREDVLSNIERGCLFSDREFESYHFRFNFKIGYFSMVEILQGIKSSDFKIPHEVLEAEFIILDDLGSENITDWSREKIFEIIDTRATKKLKTVITTNLTLGEMKERLHERVVSRILGMCVPIAIKGDDFRKNFYKTNLDILKNQAGLR